jgi:hypothetical protein
LKITGKKALPSCRYAFNSGKEGPVYKKSTRNNTNGMCTCQYTKYRFSQLAGEKAEELLKWKTGDGALEPDNLTRLIMADKLPTVGSRAGVLARDLS